MIGRTEAGVDMLNSAEQKQSDTGIDSTEQTRRTRKKQKVRVDLLSIRDLTMQVWEDEDKSR